MGIDIYARARRETDNIVKQAYEGKTGYLREAYHGGPYVTKFLVAESFDHDKYTVEDENEEKIGVQIPVKDLLDRLPQAVMLAIYREIKIYGNGEMPKGFMAELSDENGLATVVDGLKSIFSSMDDNSHRMEAAALTDTELEAAREMIAGKRECPQIAQNFIDFVKFCEDIETKTGEPAFIYASY